MLIDFFFFKALRIVARNVCFESQLHIHFVKLQSKAIQLLRGQGLHLRGQQTSWTAKLAPSPTMCSSYYHIVFSILPHHYVSFPIPFPCCMGFHTPLSYPPPTAWASTWPPNKGFSASSPAAAWASPCPSLLLHQLSPCPLALWAFLYCHMVFPVLSGHMADPPLPAHGVSCTPLLRETPTTQAPLLHGATRISKPWDRQMCHPMPRQSNTGRSAWEVIQESYFNPSQATSWTAQQ